MGEVASCLGTTFALATPGTARGDVSPVFHEVQDGIADTTFHDPQTGADFFVVRVNPRRVSIRVIAAENASLEQTAQSERPLVLVNGGFFEPDHRPSGLVVANGRQVAPLSVDLRQSGVFVVESGRPRIIRANQLAPSRHVEQALQAGPMVIESGGQPGIRSDGPQAERTVVAMDRSGCVFLIVSSSISLFQLQRALPRIVRNVDVALNLDGGPSTGVVVQAGSVNCKTLPGSPRTPTALGIFARTAH